MDDIYITESGYAVIGPRNAIMGVSGKIARVKKSARGAINFEHLVEDAARAMKEYLQEEGK